MLCQRSYSLTRSMGIGLYTTLEICYLLKNDFKLSIDKRLQKRFTKLVQSHVSVSTRAAHGVKTGIDSTKAASQAQAMWRFLSNDSVKPTELIKPLQQAVRESCSGSSSPFVLVIHDWCKLDFKRHLSKSDLLQVTHEHDIGYDLTASLAVEADHGVPLAPVATHVRTSKKLHSTCTAAPKRFDHHLNQLAPTMDEIETLELGRKPVHIIDREADSLGHFRTWSAAGHLFLVRCDHRRVKHEGKSVMLSEINEKLNADVLFQKAGTARYHGKKVQRQVAEVEVALSGAHTTRVGGKQREISGAPLTMRAVFVRLVDKDNYILAEWMLLTNVPASDADAATIGLWYYFRWRIESFFKLLKSAGHEIEYWQQTTGKAIQPFQGGLGLAVVCRFRGFLDKRCLSSNLLVATCLARALGSFAFGFFGPRGCLGYRLRSASLPHWSNWSASFAMLIF